uniref:Uncharacterized protein n=1 Tax=Arundo donax TaxID=35708 RepID=A0A0A9C0H9_ARUDO
MCTKPKQSNCTVTLFSYK